MTEPEPVIHLVIPDTQAKDGVPTDHLTWIGNYIVDEYRNKNIKIIHLGDHADMPSLSSYDKGKKSMEGRRVVKDIEAANEAWRILNQPIYDLNEIRRKTKHAQWDPERHIILGNHEDRINRATENDAQIDGLFSVDDLDYERSGWQVKPYKEVLWLDGVAYSHFFYNPMTGNPYAGTAETRLKTIGHTFTMGHQQTLMYSIRFVAGKSQHGLVAGSCLIPSHKVLTADLRYIPLGDLEVGDKIVSFDEEVTGRRSRRFKTGTVQALKIEPAPVFNVYLDDGKMFTTTSDHMWLSRVSGPAAVKNDGSYIWRSTASLRPGTRVVRPLEEWNTDSSYEGGYISGLFDGEGCLYQRKTSGGSVAQLGLSQKPGLVLDKAMTLGRISTSASQSPRVVAVEPAGVQDIIRIDVDAKTMIVEGYAHHNCYLHNEDYRGPQANAHWRGIIVKHQVHDGSYDPMFVSLNYLCQRYEGASLASFLQKKYKFEHYADGIFATV